MIELANLWSSLSNRSWEECIPASERTGGPSPWGNSRYSCFERCPHLYELYHVRELRPTQRKHALEVGGLYHEVRARYYIQGVDASYELLNRCEKHAPGTVAEVRRMFDCWLSVYGPESGRDDRGETLLVEHLIEVQDPFPYSCRLDRLVWSHELGGPLIMEIKTASRRSESLLLSYRADPQFLGQQYCYMRSNLKDQYGPLRGFVVDLTIKTNSIQIYRETVPVDLDLIRIWMKERLHTWQEMEACRKARYWPRRRSNCILYSELCEAHDHCANPTRKGVSGWIPKEEEE